MEIQNNSPAYGSLFHESDIKLHRKWFEEMCHLKGVNVIYRQCRADKHWTTYSEIDSNYYEPQLISCLFNEFPD